MSSSRQVEHLDREVLAFGQQLALAVLDGNSCLFEQGDALFVEPAFGLNGDSDHIAIDFYGFFFVLALATVPRMAGCRFRLTLPFPAALRCGGLYPGTRDLLNKNEARPDR